MLYAQWQRLGRAGWHVPALLTLVVLLVGLVLPVGGAWLLETTGGVGLAVGLLAIVLGCAVGVAGCWIVARRGVWISGRGVRLQRLVGHEVVPWQDVGIVSVEPVRFSLGGRICAATIEPRAAGHRLALPGTSDAAAWVLRASSPGRIRHELVRERRHRLAQSLPRRRPISPRPADGGVHVVDIDLRDPHTGEPMDLRAPVRHRPADPDGSGGNGGRAVDLDLRDPRTGELVDLRAPLQPEPGEARRPLPPARL
jgi:hypothetical protein